MRGEPTANASVTILALENKVEGTAYKKPLRGGKSSRYPGHFVRSIALFRSRLKLRAKNITLRNHETLFYGNPPLFWRAVRDDWRDPTSWLFVIHVGSPQKGRSSSIETARTCPIETVFAGENISKGRENDEGKHRPLSIFLSRRGPNQAIRGLCIGFSEFS